MPFFTFEPVAYKLLMAFAATTVLTIIVALMRAYNRQRRVKKALYTFDLERQQTSRRPSRYSPDADRARNSENLFGIKALDAGFHDGTVQATNIPRQSSAMRFRRLSQNDEVVNTRSRKSSISPGKGRNAYLRQLDDRQQLHQSRRDMHNGFRQYLTQNPVMGDHDESADQEQNAIRTSPHPPGEKDAGLEKPQLNRQKKPQRKLSLDLGDLTNLERESVLSVSELEWNFDRRQRHASSYGIASNPLRQRQRSNLALPSLQMPPRREIVSLKPLTPISSISPAYSSTSSRASILPRLPSPPPFARSSRRSLPQRLTPNFLQARRQSERPRPRTLPFLFRRSVFGRNTVQRNHGKEAWPSNRSSKAWRIPTMDFHHERLVGKDDCDLVDSWYFRDPRETENDYGSVPPDYEAPVSGAFQGSTDHTTIDPTTDNQATLGNIEMDDMPVGSPRPSSSMVLVPSHRLSSSSYEQVFTQGHHLNPSQQGSHHRFPSHHSLHSHRRQIHPASSHSLRELAQRPPSFPPPSLPHRQYRPPERLPLYQGSLHPSARNFSTASAVTTAGETATSTLSTSSLLSSYYARSLNDFTRGGLTGAGNTAQFTASTTVPTLSSPISDSDYSLDKRLHMDGYGVHRAKREDVEVYELDEGTWLGGRLGTDLGSGPTAAAMETESSAEGEKGKGKDPGEDWFRPGRMSDASHEREHRAALVAKRREGVVWA